LKNSQKLILNVHKINIFIINFNINVFKKNTLLIVDEITFSGFLNLPTSIVHVHRLHGEAARVPATLVEAVDGALLLADARRHQGTTVRAEHVRLLRQATHVQLVPAGGMRAPVPHAVRRPEAFERHRRWNVSDTEPALACAVAVEAAAAGFVFL
jgi:hypothetical protein